MESGNYKSWEEEIYWKNFHFARFSLTLPSNFRNHLLLPKKFADYMRIHLPDKVALKVNGVTWHVNLEKEKNDVMLCGNGWQEFAKAYSLKKSDTLIFKYNRHDCFEVLIFDQANLCEKEASYFVRKVQPPNSNGSDDSSEEEKETSVEEASDKNRGDDESDGTLGSRRKKKRDGYDGDVGDDTSDEEISVSTDEYTTPKKATTTERVRKVPSNLSRKRPYKVSEMSQKTTPKRRKGHALAYKSNRRTITEAEKAKALEKAKKASTQYLNSFIVIMQPSSVYKRFYMSIPKEWEPRHVFKKGQQVILRVKEKTWTCVFNFNRYNGGFEGGWKRFAIENLLEESDVCLFVPTTSSNGGKPVLNVTIFRVTPVVVPPSPVTASNVEVQEISSEERSLGDDDYDYGSRRKSSGVTPKCHYSGSNAHKKEDFREDESDESSDEEKSSTEEERTPKKAATTARVRKVTANSSGKSGKTTPGEYGACCNSTARQVTEAEKKEALKKAKEAAGQYKYSLIEVMKQSSVRRRFFLSFSKNWKVRRGLRNDQEVILRVKDKTWTCTFILSSNNVGLLTGWKHFVPDNKLEESDVCVFVPAEEQDGNVVLDVIIVRARPELA